MTPSEPTQNLARGADREARLARGPEAEPVGACIYLTPAEIDALGVDPETTERLRYTVDEETGKLAIEAIAPEEVSE